MSKSTWLWVAVLLLLVYWAARTWAITAFPPFIDEGTHLQYTYDALNSGLLAHSEEGRQFVFWFYLLFDAHSGSALWIARVITILATTVGAAALIGTAKLLSNAWGALATGMLLTFSPYHQFFERLALADPVASAAVLVALYFAARLIRRTSLVDATLCGIALFIAFGSKVSTLPYYALPVFAVIVFRRNRSGMRWGAVALLEGGILSLLFIGILEWRGYNPFFYLETRSGSGIITTILTNIGRTSQTLIGYFGVITSLLLLGSIIFVTIRRRFLLPFALLVPLLVLWLSPRQDSRHIATPVTLLLLCAGVALGLWIQQHWKQRLPLMGVTAFWGLAFWGLALWLPFTFTLLSAPMNLPLPVDDRSEYMTSEGSGVGLSTIIDTLESRHPVRVIGVLANCTSLVWIAPFPVECPQLNPNGESVPALEAYLADNQMPGVYAILEDLAYAPTSAPGSVIATVDANRPRLTIYDLAP